MLTWIFILEESVGGICIQSCKQLVGYFQNDAKQYLKLTKSMWFFKITRSASFKGAAHEGTWIVLVNLFEKHEGGYAQ